MLGLLLLVLVLWIALGLDRSRRHRLHDPRPAAGGQHRHRAVPYRRHLRRDGLQDVTPRGRVIETQRLNVTIPHQRSRRSQSTPAGIGRHTAPWLASNGRAA